jgi:hypothetical protein
MSASNRLPSFLLLSFLRSFALYLKSCESNHLSSANLDYEADYGYCEMKRQYLEVSYRDLPQHDAESRKKEHHLILPLHFRKAQGSDHSSNNNSQEEAILAWRKTYEIEGSRLSPNESWHMDIELLLVYPLIN